MRFKVKKTHYFPHTVHYCCSSMLRLSETCRFLQSSSFWEARCALIGQLSSALWLAKYLKREMKILRPSPYCDVVSRREYTQKKQQHYKPGIDASSGDIIADSNDLYCLFTCGIALRRVNITMYAFVIGNTTNNKHYSTLLKTHVWIISDTFFK